jgi:hypothetical protein
MKIFEDYDKNTDVIFEIKKAELSEHYKVRLVFSDGTEQMVNFESFLKKSLHPSIRKYLDLTRFKSFKIVDGNLNWNDYDMIFPIADLYEGKL